MGGARTQYRGQAGFVLPMVIGVTLLLVLVTMALFTYLFTSMRVTEAAGEQADGLRAADSALEAALQEWRFEESLVNTPCSGETFDVGDIEVACSNPTATPPTAAARVMDLEAKDGTGRTVGSARVRVLDESNAVQAVGYSVEVCDWLIGRAAANSPLRGCSS